MGLVIFLGSICCSCRSDLQISDIPELPGFSSIASAFAENVNYLTMFKFCEMAKEQ